MSLRHHDVGLFLQVDPVRLLRVGGRDDFGGGAGKLVGGPHQKIRIWIRDEYGLNTCHKLNPPEAALTPVKI